MVEAVFRGHRLGLAFDLQRLRTLRDVGRHFTINRMLTFDSVRIRLEREQPLTFLEFNYMILQAYDFRELALVLGESVVDIGIGAEGHPVTVSLALSAVLGLALTAALWTCPHSTATTSGCRSRSFRRSCANAGAENSNFPNPKLPGLISASVV